MQAHPKTYWKSAMNIFDFSVVLLCVISIPIYFYIPDSDFILTCVLLLRFAAQLLRIVMVYKHHEHRSAYMETTRDDLVDFTGLNANTTDTTQDREITDTASSSYQNPSFVAPSSHGLQSHAILYDNGSYNGSQGSLRNVNADWDV